MKIVKIEREIAHKLNVANYESIVPSLRMSAELEGDDDPVAARKLLDTMIEAEWNRLALQELRMVYQRRQGKIVGDDTVPALLNYFKEQIA